MFIVLSESIQAELRCRREAMQTEWRLFMVIFSLTLSLSRSLIFSHIGLSKGYEILHAALSNKKKNIPRLKCFPTPLPQLWYTISMEKKKIPDIISIKLG